MSRSTACKPFVCLPYLVKRRAAEDDRLELDGTSVALPSIDGLASHAGQVALNLAKLFLIVRLARVYQREGIKSEKAEQDGPRLKENETRSRQLKSSTTALDFIKTHQRQQCWVQLRTAHRGQSKRQRIS